MPADRHERQHPKDRRFKVGTKEHAKAWGLPKEVLGPFTTFTRDPQQYVRVKADKMGTFLKKDYEQERRGEMERETEEDLYIAHHPVPKRVRYPPLKLNHLEIVRTLGRGQEGSVYMVKIKEGMGHSPETTKQDKATNARRTKYEFAMKAIPKRIMRHVKPGEIARHLLDKDNELCKLTTIDWSPFVCGLLQTFEDPLNVYLLLECMPNGTLRDLMKPGSQLTLPDSTFYFMNIVCGIKHLRDNGIVHRDIKPENILLGSDGYLVLTDFGSSAFANDDEAEWTHIGTPLYGPPETQQFWEVDPSKTEDLTTEDRYSIDMYCAGMIFFEMITGRLPFVDQVTSDYLQKKNRMICWPKDIVLGIHTKRLIRQLLHYRARFRPEYSDLQSSPFFKADMPQGYDWWRLVGERKFIPPLIPEEYDLELTRHTLPMPLQSEVPGVSVREPKHHLADDLAVKPHKHVPPDNLGDLIERFEAGVLE